MFTPFLVVLKESSKEQQFGAPLAKTPELHRTHMFATHFCRFARRWEVRAISALHLLHRSACDGHDGGEAVTRTQGSTSACLSFSHFFCGLKGTPNGSHHLQGCLLTFLSFFHGHGSTMLYLLYSSLIAVAILAAL